VVVVAYDGYNRVNESVIYIKTPFIYPTFSSTTSTFLLPSNILLTINIIDL
jgi:hypothetical protein